MAPEVVQPLPASPVASVGVARAHTPDRGEILAFCEKYRRALELRDPAMIMALVSPRYSDDGTTYDTLEGQMRRIFREANSIRYEIKYGDVGQRGDAITVDYSYTASFLMADGWHHKVGDAELVLVRRGDSFAIISGM